MRLKILENIFGNALQELNALHQRIGLDPLNGWNDEESSATMGLEKVTPPIFHPQDKNADVNTHIV